MRIFLITWYNRLRASYWFLPMLMALGSIALALGTSALDRQIGGDWLDGLSILKSNQPQGAHTVLSTIAGSMITVAGVTFSMTLAAVSFASSTFGPRLIGNFMRDRGNQFTLGTFIATFTYCLLILRTIRTAENGFPGMSDEEASELAAAFVPQISVLTGLALALCSVGVLIYFIHHIPETINVSNITAALGRKLLKSIEGLYPTRMGEPGRLPDGEMDWGTPESQGRLEEYFAQGAPVVGQGSGYILAIDKDHLVEVARRHELMLRLEYRPGDFTTPGDVVMLAFPADKLSEEASDELLSCIALGSDRTSTQDMPFLVEQLLEMIGRALSPGINDAFTAINCLNWLKCGIALMAERGMPDPLRHDEDGHLRVVTYAMDFEQLVERVFSGVRSYLAADRLTALHTMKVLGDLIMLVENPAQRAALLAQAEALAQAGEEALKLSADRAELAHRFRELQAAMAEPETAWRLRDSQGWLGGRG